MLRAGAATTVITPPAGLEMEGYLRDGPSVGVLDELTCQAVAFDDGPTQLVVATALAERIIQAVTAAKTTLLATDADSRPSCQRSVDGQLMF